MTHAAIRDAACVLAWGGRCLPPGVQAAFAVRLGRLVRTAGPADPVWVAGEIFALADQLRAVAREN